MVLHKKINIIIGLIDPPPPYCCQSDQRLLYQNCQLFPEIGIMNEVLRLIDPSKPIAVKLSPDFRSKCPQKQKACLNCQSAILDNFCYAKFFSSANLPGRKLQLEHFVTGFMRLGFLVFETFVPGTLSLF